jgi:putative peptidoglycan lipid II flippase
VRQVFALMLPRMAGVAVIYLNVLVGTALASQIPYEGAVAALSFGWRIQQVPATIIGLGIGGVLFPSLAALAADGQLDRLRSTFSWGLRALILLTVPAAAALVLLGRHAIGVVLRGGNFGDASTESVMAALQFYAVGLVGYSALEIVARALFAQRDTRTPFFVACGALVANALLGLALRAPLGHGGLALAQSLAVSAEVLVLLAVLRRRMGGVDGRALAATLARALAGAGAMALAIGATLRAVAPLTDGWPERLALLAEVGLASLAGLAVYLAVTFVLGSAELRALPGLVRRRGELAGAELPATVAVAELPAEAPAD